MRREAGRTGSAPAGALHFRRRMGVSALPGNRGTTRGIRRGGTIAFFGISIKLVKEMQDVFTVTTAQESGPGSLQQAIPDANAWTGGFKIAIDAKEEYECLQRTEGFSMQNQCSIHYRSRGIRRGIFVPGKEPERGVAALRRAESDKVGFDCLRQSKSQRSGRR